MATQESKTKVLPNNVPKHSRWMSAIPPINLVLALVTLGLAFAAPVYTSYGDRSPTHKYGLISVPAVALTSVTVLYIMIAETAVPKLYNYYIAAILALMCKSLNGVAAGLLLGVVVDTYTGSTMIAAMSLHFVQVFLWFVYCIWLLIAIIIHRKRGGHSKYSPELVNPATSDAMTRPLAPQVDPEAAPEAVRHAPGNDIAAQAQRQVLQAQAAHGAQQMSRITNPAYGPSMRT